MTKKKAAPEKASKTTKTSEAEKPAKAGKASLKAAAEEPTTPPASTEDQGDADDIDEDESASSGGGGGNEAALAAAGSGEMSASFKNFRHHPDMENFYRFIYENDLRHEALAILEQVVQRKQEEKQIKKPATTSPAKR